MSHLRITPLGRLFFLLFLPVAAASWGSAPADASTAPATASIQSAQRLSLERSTGWVVPVRERIRGAGELRRAGHAAQTGDTVWLFQDDLENKSSPSNEGGWTHADASFQPAAWHIDTVYGCEGKAFWCGVVDSSWVNDPNRFGYDNSWTQFLENYVNLSGAAGPVNLSFKHQMDAEPGFDGGDLEVLDPEYSWIHLRHWQGPIHGQSGAACESVTMQIPDSIIAKYNPVHFRFVFQSDIEGSSSDGIYPSANGWSLDNVTVKAGISDLRFFDDFEFGEGTWTKSTFPAVGDFWRIQANAPAEQFCTSNASKVWTVTSPITGALVPRMDDELMSPAIAVNHADQVFASFDVYRNLPLYACFYYNIQYRTRTLGAPWSPWAQSSSQIYFGSEKEWMRQLVPLPGASGKDSAQFMINVKDYSQIYCDGVSTTTGTVAYFDNLALGIVGLAPPAIVVAEQDLFQDTFKTSPFFADDNFNTPRGDSVSVRLSASRGLKQAALLYRLNGGSFASVPLVPFGAAIPAAYSADVPAGSYSRGTQLSYYFSVTDSLDETVTLPSDALTASHYFTATILPAIQPPSSSCAGDIARILYVNAYAGPDGGASMDQSLAALGLRFDRYDVNAAANSLGNSPGGAPPGDPVRLWPATTAAQLGVYSGIIWDVGERSSVTFTAEDQGLLSAWVKLPGANRGLIAAGENIAYDMTVNGQDVGSFLGCTLGATYLRDIWENTPQDSLTPALSGAAGTRIASEPFPLDGQCPALNRFDAMLVSACAPSMTRNWILYPNSLVAAVEKRDSVGVVADSSRTVLLGFGLGQISSTTRRNYLLYRTLVEEFEIPSCYLATSVEASTSAAASRPRLLGASPNPFNPHTAIRFVLPRPSRVRLLVFDVSGARVRRLAEGFRAAGEHGLIWDGKDDRGSDLASGAYFYRLEADDFREAGKLILLR